MAGNQPVVSQHETRSASFVTYLTGFALSIVLTLIAYFSVTSHWLRGNGLIGFIVFLALIQFFVQLFFFLHLGSENRPRWRLLMLFFMITVVLILVVGSIWIIYNLNYRMTPQQINNYMRVQDGGL